MASLKDNIYELFFNQAFSGFAVCKIIYDKDDQAIDFVFLDVNNAFENQSGLKKEDILGKKITEILPDANNDDLLDIYEEVVKKKVKKKFDRYFKTLKKWFELAAYPLQKNQFAIIFINITDRKKREKKIIQLSYHDSLTGLYNRNYLQKNMESLNRKINLPLSIVMADINSLRLVNDSFGHKTGDKFIKSAAQILQKNLRKQDIVSRWAGDEFTIILPQTSAKKTKKIINKIKKELEKTKIKSISLSLAFGVSVKKKLSVGINKKLQEADDNMYKNKLVDKKSVHSNLLDTLIKTLEVKSSETMSHSMRMVQLAFLFGDKCHLVS
jgi:diguanylate cyclase (GGDEF)-like protein/PAS domain S-box-containing protein